MFNYLKENESFLPGENLHTSRLKFITFVLMTINSVKRI